MNILDKLIDNLDTAQRRFKPAAFIYGVVKKYGDDQVGYQAALVTYYGFLSLFPLLLVLTTVAGIAGRHNPALGTRLVHDVSQYFPVIGQSLDNSVHALKQTGPALIIGVLFAAYGARGVADAFRHAVNDIWHIPRRQRSGFPRNLLRSFGLAFGGGGGFLLAAAIAGWTAAAGHGWPFHLLSSLINIAVLYLVFMLVLRLSLPLSLARSRFRLSALIAALGIALLQTVGSLIVARSAKHLTTTYSALFATTLGMLAWIYLQVQVVLYAVVADTVRDGHFWPRSLSGRHLTPADKQLED